MFFRILFPLLLVLCALPAGGREMTRAEVPAPLRPWIEWVLFDHPDHACPVSAGQQRRDCLWPSLLRLQLDDAGGSFEFLVRAFGEGWQILPGAAGQWPEEVQRNGEELAAVLRDGRPAVYLGPGTHHLTGRFRWPELPQSLALPAGAGLLSLWIAGSRVEQPRREADGRLWLREREPAPAGETEGDRLSLSVSRRLSDDIPVLLTTHLELQVSGRERETSLVGALPEGFIPLALRSPLPARVEADGRLRLQLRPGRWRIELDARHPGPLRELALPASTSPWPQEEIWVFQARPENRLVEIRGVPAVDPRQTRLPSAWQSLPAYRLVPGARMELHTLRRGDPEPEPDRLALRRELWLDFSGRGYTLHDRIEGTVTRTWRLEVEPGIVPGRVTINGQPQFITRRADDATPGVELRRGALELEAESRIDGAAAELPANGWQVSLQRATARLNLPPGWRLLAAAGADNRPDTWLSRWTLLDLFLVLVATLAAGRLWGMRAGVLTLATLVLIWHEPGAPRYVWLNLLGALALLRLLPDGRAAALVRGYRNLTLLALALIAIPFLVDQARTALYPQLERSWQQLDRAPGARRAGQGIPTMAAAPAPEMRVAEQAAVAGKVVSGTGSDGKAAEVAKSVTGSSPQRYDLGLSGTTSLVDPSARIQTGPGRPGWRWRQVSFSWKGPLEPGQRLRLWLIPPWGNGLLGLLRVVLVLGLALFLLRVVARRARLPGAGTALLLLLLPLWPGPLPQARAAELPEPQGQIFRLGDAGAGRVVFPPPRLLQQLEERLLRLPACHPDCATLSLLRLHIGEGGLTLILNIDTAARTALPLPSAGDAWQPWRVQEAQPPGTLIPDTSPWLQKPLRRRGDTLWLVLEPGRHRLELSGPLPDVPLTLSLPLPPQRVQVESGDWKVRGLRPDGTAGPALRLEPPRRGEERAQSGDEDLTPRALPPFARVERTLRLGLDWHVETRLLRRSPADSPLLLHIPLLPGEAVTTQGVQVRDGAVVVSLQPAQKQFAWQSTLERGARIELVAPRTDAWTEVWRVDVGPVWHMEYQGIPVVHHQDRSGNWLPEWRPWPGERVTLRLSRPAGIPGPTVTLERARLQMRPARRASELTLSLELRASQGGQQSLNLPAGTRLQRARIDGRSQPLRQDGRLVTLPLHPGSQRIELDLRATEGLRTLLHTPSFGLGLAGTNYAQSLALPQSRWVLFAGGPGVGPAVLFWGVLLVLIPLAWGLGRLPLTPLGPGSWYLLGVGLSQVPVAMGLTVAGWLLALGARARLRPDTGARLHDLIQLGLALLTLVALGLLWFAIRQGLLGLPEMQVAGNGSSAWNLHWYLDRVEGATPTAWVLSLPILAYRLLMLAWALWLAFALLRWLRWGWSCYTSGGLWKPLRRKG